MTFLYGSRLKKPQLCILYKEIPMGQANMTAQETFHQIVHARSQGEGTRVRRVTEISDESFRRESSRDSFRRRHGRRRFGGGVLLRRRKSTSSSSSASKTSGENENQASTTLAPSVESSSSGSSSAVASETVCGESDGDARSPQSVQSISPRKLSGPDRRVFQRREDLQRCGDKSRHASY